MPLSRRKFLASAAAAPLFGQAPTVIPSEKLRPRVDWGAMSGDVSPRGALLWARTDRPSRMEIELPAGLRVDSPYALEDSDFTARVHIPVPGSGRIPYRIRFRSLADGTLSAPLEGSFAAAPRDRRDIRFLWSGDTCGQGWGINAEFGGFRGYETMRLRRPDFFLHSGDTIYADGPIQSEVALPDGKIWKNLVTAEKSKVAETLDEFRGNYRYNLLDAAIRRFNAEVPQVWQWDDHEVRNNWSPGSDLRDDSRYTEKNIHLLAARGAKAFREYSPIADPSRIFRRIAYGPLLDVFVIDLRSLRGPNTANRQAEQSPDTAYLGAGQLEWLKSELKASTAVWKVIASDMPVGLIVPDGRDSEGRPRFENCANGDGPPLGRELEIASLLSYVKRNRIRNTVWLTADVHYTAAHYYDPGKAQFTDFDPFWEFVSGPIHAGTFGPAALDNTFGPQVLYSKAPPPGQANLPPSAGLQFFGEVEIDGQTRALRVTLRDLNGAELYSKSLEAQT